MLSDEHAPKRHNSLWRRTPGAPVPIFVDVPAIAASSSYALSDGNMPQTGMA